MRSITKKTRNKPITIGEIEVMPGEQQSIDLPLAAMVTHNDVKMPLHVIHGKAPGPCLFVSAAIHGDEINGVEIIRRLVNQKQMKNLKGTLIAIPIVNVHGFISNSRYLPDGRDLNRSFPGSEKGSLAGRIAHTFFCNIVKKCTHGIDLHTGARHRDNLPQIRANMTDPEVERLALSFGVPVIIDSKIRDGSLRAAGGDEDIPILLYEAGESLRFNEIAIRAGVRGVLNVIRELGMLSKQKAIAKEKSPIISRSTSWIRAPISGILRLLVPLGAKTSKDSVLGIISDPLGQSEVKVLAQEEGIVIGRTNLPLTHEGDALFHIAYYKNQAGEVLEQVENFQEYLDPESENQNFNENFDEPIQ